MGRERAAAVGLVLALAAGVGAYLLSAWALRAPEPQPWPQPNRGPAAAPPRPPALGPCAGLAGRNDLDVRGPEWSADGRQLVFAARVGEAAGLDLWLLEIADFDNPARIPLEARYEPPPVAELPLDLEQQVDLGHQDLRRPLPDAGNHVQLRNGCGNGLRGMRERAMLIGARLSVATAPGGGGVLTLQVPIEARP